MSEQQDPAAYLTGEPVESTSVGKGVHLSVSFLLRVDTNKLGVRLTINTMRKSSSGQRSVTETARPAPPTVTMSKAWWEHPAASAALILSLSLPLWFTPLPPLIDLPTHMASYRVESDLAHDPLLQRNWGFHWSLIGNLGVDLLVWPLAKLVGLERAVWWIVASIPPLLAWGMLRAARVVHGRVPGTALAALPFALAYPYQYGFVNFWLGLALAFHAYAFWPRSSGGRR